VSDRFSPPPSALGLSRNALIAGSVVLFHVAALWALQSGLLRRAAEVVIPVEILSEFIEPPKPKELPPPPPPPPAPKPQVAKTPPPPRPQAIREPKPTPAFRLGIVFNIYQRPAGGDADWTFSRTVRVFRSPDGRCINTVMLRSNLSTAWRPPVAEEDLPTSAQQDLLSSPPAIPSPVEVIQPKPSAVSSDEPQAQYRFDALNRSESFIGTCPDCGSSLEFAEGCAKCHVCGFSECG